MPPKALLLALATIHLWVVAVVGLPTGFIENAGQFPRHIRYYAIRSNGMFYVTARGYGYVLWDTAGRQRSAACRLEMRALSRTHASLEPDGVLPTVLNFYHAHHRIEGVRMVLSIRLRGLFPGVDAIIRYTPSGRIKCDYILSPGVDASCIAFRISGAVTTITPDGRLQHTTPVGTITEAAPIAFQGTTAIPARYQSDGQILRFTIEGPYDRNRTLTIDPEIEWSTFAGGGLTDQIAHVQTDPARNIIILGRTQSANFPTKLGYSSIHRGDFDACVAKYSASGTLQWATYYGGSRREIHNLDHCDLVVDRTGSITITGCTQSDDLPLTPTAFQRAKGSSMPTGYDLFLASFSPSGQLLWASYCGGNDNEDAFGLSLDPSGNVYVVGHTSSSNFPASSPSPAVVAPKPTTSQDVFVLKLTAQHQPVWVFFLGGNDLEYATDVVCDRSGGIYVCGYTQSENFPTRGDQIYQRIKTPKNDGYIFKLDGLGRLQWSTLLGGNGEDYCATIAIDSSFDRRIIVGGMTSSSDLWFLGREGRTLGGSNDGFIAALDIRTGAADWVQYHGGTSYDELTALAVDPDNNIIAVGRSLGGYPTRSAQQPTYNGGGGDMFIAKLGADGITQWATYAGGSALDRASDVAIDGNTNFVVVGYSASSDFPIIGDAEQPTLGNLAGTDDGVIIKFCNIAIPTAFVSATPEYCQGETRTLSALNRGSSVQYDSYQWELNGTPIEGATNATYVIPPSQDSGTYRFVCRVTNTARCPAVTDTIIVRIYAPPRIAARQFAVCTGDPIRLDSITIEGTPPFRYQWSGDPPPDDPTAPAPIVHPQQTTTYTLHVTDAHGCSAERTFPVVVLPISQLAVTVFGERTFCEGDSVVLELPGNIGTIEWNTGERSPRITVRTTGLYHAHIRLPSGCEGYSDTIPVVVRPHPQPTITFDGIFLATSSSYDRYQWYLDGNLLPGATTQAIEPPRIGTYWVEVDSLGCSATSNPLDIALSAQTHISIGSATAAIGERIGIPIQFTTTHRLDRLGVSRLLLRIGYNATVLQLLPTPATGIEYTGVELHADRTATVTLSISLLDRDTLAVLNFLAVWGNAESSEIVVEAVEWGSPLVSTTWTDGRVQLLGFCRAGATRLFEDTGEFGIRSIVPQPASEGATVIIGAIEDAEHALVLRSMDGRTQTLFREPLRAGTYAVALDLSAVSPGYYVLELGSLTLRTWTSLVIVR
ncbi:MAG: hypothetical protein KatS3mg039_0971 [Candidatus Kapaibacterium sp.]|nr:MAG: hypothetical protein KatS3mg039_0971 [Candidatus Kapabacteria bacterium]